MNVERLLKGTIAIVAVIIIGVIFFLIAMAVVLNFGGLWIRAYTSNARVSFFELIGMKLRQVNAGTIVDAKIMAMQAGVGTDPETGITTKRLEAHYLAGGDVHLPAAGSSDVPKRSPAPAGASAPDPIRASKPLATRRDTADAGAGFPAPGRRGQPIHQQMAAAAVATTRVLAKSLSAVMAVFPESGTRRRPSPWS